MVKLFIIARANMRRAKGQTAAIVVLVLLAALMLNLWLMLSTDYRANFDRYHDKLNAEHVTLSVDDADGAVAKFLTEKLDNDAKVKEYRLDECLHFTGMFPYNGGNMNAWFVFLKKDVALTRSIGKAEIVEQGNYSSGVYLPMLYKSDEIKTGAKIKISVGSHTVEYTICGFFNSVMMGSHNCSLTEIMLTDDKYAELELSRYALRATLCSVRLKNRSENLNYAGTLKNVVSQFFPSAEIMSNNYDTVAQARYIAQMICSGIMSAMAFFVLLIALVVIVSNIINFIQVNIKNLGALKAVGYTSRQLIGSLLLQFTGLAFLISIVGAGLSYCIYPAINAMMISQTGIPYAIRFLPLPVFISQAILCGTVALSVWLASRRIKKIEPITALRSGLQTHNFKRNRVSLETTKAPLNVALALKTTLSGLKQNITVCVTMMVLSLVVVFSGLMTENVIADISPFVNLIVGETADSCINVNTQAEDEFLRIVGADDRVEKVYLYNSINVVHVGGAELVATLCDDFSKVNNKNVVIKGRFPVYDNEIAIAAKYAEERNFRIGNEIEIASNGGTQKYLISGFTQISNNLGRDCLMTRQGYMRLSAISNASYYLNLADGADIDAFNEYMKAALSGKINTAINIDKTVRAAGGVYVTLMTIIVVAILVLSVVIIAFVLYLLVRTVLNNKRRDYGIFKALGFTTRMLILQTALSFMPAVVLSTVVGLAVGCAVINPLMSLFLSSIGIVKCTFSVPIGFVAAAGAALTALSFGITCLLSLKIRKIAPRALLVGE